MSSCTSISKFLTGYRQEIIFPLINHKMWHKNKVIIIQLGITSGFPYYGFPGYFCHYKHVLHRKIFSDYYCPHVLQSFFGYRQEIIFPLINHKMWHKNKVIIIQLGITSGFPYYGFPGYFCHYKHVLHRKIFSDYYCPELSRALFWQRYCDQSTRPVHP